ncbi:MAG: hypothetical protein AMK72_05005 [Planctomycetes bacterium SM23_25]|nr:MAG: hypothetical protein AMK72_05005 [Planctomycetes bacterium SM23_25]
MKRRDFLMRGMFRPAVVVLGGGTGLEIMLAEAFAQPRSCGPPPAAKPQRRTAAESLPPLPLPATPLRRSEKKREPSPPALVGKVILGDVKWETRDGQRYAFRDWMTDPADMQNLLTWTNEQLHIRYRVVDADLAEFSYNPTELPTLYFTGHDAFTVPDAVIPRLRQFCIDGGTILGDACCGAPAFDQAFRRLVQQLFPKRPMEPLPTDHPLYSSFYPISSVHYREEGRTDWQDLPELEAVSIGCRAAIVYTGGYDCSCGWDGHVHEHGKRVLPADARKLGANIITYALATYELGRFLSTERVYHQTGQPTRDQLVIAQVIHDGDWDTQPSSLASLLKHLAENTTVEVQFKKEDVDLRSIDAFAHPILYMTGHKDFTLSDDEVNNLRRYLAAGGVLVANACCGRKAFDTAFRREIARVLPDHKLDRVALEHPVYRSVFPIDKVSYTPLVIHEHPGMFRPTLEGISIENQLRVVYSPYGFVNGWSGAPNPYDRGYEDKDALRLGINILVYAMTH